MTVSLQGLTSGQMYYCKAAATNTNSNNCAGPVVGGVKVLFSLDMKGDGWSIKCYIACIVEGVYAARSMV